MIDELNPKYLYSAIPTKLLCRIVNGEIPSKDLARKELANRGQDENGFWVGFDKAKEIHKIK